MDKNQGYAILKAVMLENGRGFALGEHPTAPSRYVTWACYDDKDGQRQYEWGHYGNDRTAMEQDFADRVQDYQRIYNVGIRQTEAPGLYKYYSTQRPVDIGTFPKPPYNKPDEIFNYDQRIPVENGSFLAWGYLTYTRPLTEKQASDYELRPAPDNPDRPDVYKRQVFLLLFFFGLRDTLSQSAAVLQLLKQQRELRKGNAHAAHNVHDLTVFCLQLFLLQLLEPGLLFTDFGLDLVNLGLNFHAFGLSLIHIYPLFFDCVIAPSYKKHQTILKFLPLEYAHQYFLSGKLPTHF